MTTEVRPEPILEPDLPIVDAHHHLWTISVDTLIEMEKQETVIARGLLPTCRRLPQYLIEELIANVTSGHRVLASVFVEAHTMYRESGPEEMRSTGEVEFVDAVATAESLSGRAGRVKACAGIVGNVDLSRGDAVEEILTTHLCVGRGRYRGVRSDNILYDEDQTILGVGEGVPHLLRSKQFRIGFRWLHCLGLSFDALVLEPQLPELIDLARTFPETQIVLNHVGMPVGVGRYAGKREERFPLWRDRIRSLSRCENVVVKLGGLGVPFGGFRSHNAILPASSAQLALEWKPYIETCIEAFGVRRCMFESNFPVDAAVCSYAVLWNTFKRITDGASPEEKEALFSGTAARVYRLMV